MREIKFRAWDKKRELMICDSWLKDMYDSAKVNHPKASGYVVALMISFTNGLRYIYDNGSMQSPIFYHDEYILMQYIGFKDKNGKEIYEGDICKFSDWKPKPIKWIDGRYMLGDTLVICCKMECDNMEIIGNIYENSVEAVQSSPVSFIINNLSIQKV